MKKLFFIIAISFFMVMCKSAKTSSDTKKDDMSSVEVRYRDDFRAATTSERSNVLSELKATANEASVLIFTQNYKGEKIEVKSKGKRIYNDYIISNLDTGIGDKLKIDNTKETKVYDNLTKQVITIPADKASKYKFIYLMKNPGGEKQYILTYSNTLRPLGYDL
ncbi:hypothetical protein [Flavobacterium rhizosphaerae]|uniref:DUF4251 domain-containing protein n=1 Tax=Flavobacterium rhizosphaerae TaxID=3163298 RepID=A0ABW8YYT6_9FLAO